MSPGWHQGVCQPPHHDRLPAWSKNSSYEQKQETSNLPEQTEATASSFHDFPPHAPGQDKGFQKTSIALFNFGKSCTQRR